VLGKIPKLGLKILERMFHHALHVRLLCTCVEGQGEGERR
jgi:hypothetical protein